jgi:signal transduction histidine kinase
MKYLPRSLTGRVIAFSTIWAIAALIAIATIISALYKQAAERGFQSLLSAHLFNLIGAVSLNEAGQLAGNPNLGDLRFSIPQSGWYWSVEPETDEIGASLRSPSMTAPIPAPTNAEVPFNPQFQRAYITEGLAGEEIQVLERELLLDEENRVARFRVMGNRTELAAEIAAFARQVYTYLSLFGAGMIAINAAAILYGLRPLARVRAALSEVRAGTAERLDGDFPPEIAPLAEETNALIDNNRRIVERARTQVGNLAHSLKTPLAVIVNEAHAIGGKAGQVIIEQAGLMRHQVEHYLQRARIAAQRDSIAFRTPVQPVLERMARVMAKLAPETHLSLDMPDEPLAFAGEREDLEEIAGNLLENAMKWARSEVRVSLSGRPRSGTTAGRFALAIEDDGPGIPEERAREALKRGSRLDETKPGTGLGLAIVADLVHEYGGTLRLERSALGGLRAVVELGAAGS